MGYIGTPRKHKLNVYWTQSERKSGQPELMKDEMKIMINRSNRIKITYLQFCELFTLVRYCILTQN